MMSCVLRNSGLSSIKFLCATLSHMSISAGVVVAIPFQQIDDAPDAEACAEGDDQRLEHLDSRIEKLHSKTRGRTAHEAQTAGPAPASFQCIIESSRFALGFIRSRRRSRLSRTPRIPRRP